MTPRLKVVVFDASFGGGHRECAAAIEEYYRRHRADEVDVTTLDFFETFAPNLNVLARFAFQQSTEFFPSHAGTFEEMAREMSSNPVVEEFASGGLDRVRGYLESERPDAVLSTFSVAGGLVAEVRPPSLSVAATLIVDLDPRRAWLHPSTDIHFVANEESREALVLRGVGWENVVVSGVPVDEVFAEDASRSECRKGLGLAERFTLLLTPGRRSPSDTIDLAERAVALGIQVVLATGGDHRLSRRVRESHIENGMLKVPDPAEDMHRMMKAADVMVGTAGEAALFEALAVGVPIVISEPVPVQEVCNVDFLVNYGAALLSRDDDDVLERLRFLSAHPSRLERMASDARSLGRPSAVQAVCERIVAAARVGPHGG